MLKSQFCCTGSSSRAQLLSLRQPSRRLLVTVAASKNEQPTGDLLRPATVSSVAVLCLSTLINAAAPPSVKVACTATAIAAAVVELLLLLKSTPTASQQPPSKPNTSGTTSSSSSSSTSTAGTPLKKLPAELLAHPLFPAAASGAAAAAVASAVVPSQDLPAVSSLCLLVYVGTLVQQQLQLTPQKTRQQQKPKQQQQQQQQQEQQPEEQQGQTSIAQQSAAAQDGAVTDEDQDPELEQQLQRQVSKISSLSGKVQQLERELRQERKEGRKMDTLKEQLAASKAEAQQLAGELMVARWELQQAEQGKTTTGSEKPTGRGNGSGNASSSGGRPAPPAASTPATQAQQQPEPPASDASGQEGSAARKRVVAWVGARGMKPSDRKVLPVDVGETRVFGSPKDTGVGELKRLEAAIKAGSIDEVYMPIRWNSHNTTQIVSKLCRDRGIPVHLLGAVQKARRKQEWADATSGSDADTA